jgi:hypothetical protein
MKFATQISPLLNLNLVFNLARIMNKERKEKFFKNLEKQFGVSLKQMAKEKIGAQRTGKGIYLKPKMSISTEDEILNSVEEASPKGTGIILKYFLAMLGRFTLNLSFIHLPTCQNQLSGQATFST